MATGDRSFSDVLHDVVRNLQEIVRAEVRLAKTEVREETVKAKGAVILLSAGALCGIFATFFVLLASVYALTRIAPDWAAALMVAAAVGIAAAGAFSAGVKRWKQVHPTPEKTIETIKDNVEWAKQQTK